MTILEVSKGKIVNVIADEAIGDNYVLSKNKLTYDEKGNRVWRVELRRVVTKDSQSQMITCTATDKETGCSIRYRYPLKDGSIILYYGGRSVSDSVVGWIASYESITQSRLIKSHDVISLRKIVNVYSRINFNGLYSDAGTKIVVLTDGNLRSYSGKGSIAVYSPNCGDQGGYDVSYGFNDVVIANATWIYTRVFMSNPHVVAGESRKEYVLLSVDNQNIIDDKWVEQLFARLSEYNSWALSMDNVDDYPAI